MKTLSVILVSLLLAGPAVARAGAAVTIDMKDSWRDGEKVSFAYEITFSDGMVTFIPHIACSGNMPVAFLAEQTAATSPFKGTYYGVKIDDRSIEPQECVASVTITSEEGIRAEKRFEVAVRPSMDFSLVTCEDSACRMPRATFVKDSTVYLNYLSKVTPAASAVVVTPGGQSVPTNIPGSFVADQAGKYKLQISAAKDGFKPYSSTAEVVVLEKEQAREIPYAAFSVKAGQPVQRPVSEGGAAPSTGGCNFMPSP